MKNIYKIAHKSAFELLLLCTGTADVPLRVNGRERAQGYWTPLKLKNKIGLFYI